MKTLIISDLHLGSVSRADVLRLPHAQEALFAALDGVDRLVLLGDVLELRHGPRRDALEAAKPFFQALGARMAGAEIVIATGNHDHALVDGWLQRRGEEPGPSQLALEQRLTPEQASPMATQLARWAAPARVEVAFPGLWVRDDVYAIHGHYLDAHVTVPTMERLAIALMGKMVKRPQLSLAGIDDYEAVTAPIYAWVDAVAAQGATRSALNGTATVRVWRLLHGGSDNGSRPSASAPASGGARGSGAAWMPRSMLSAGFGASLRGGAVRRGFPLAVAVLNQAGLGPLKADISGPELRRSTLLAMGDTAAQLGLGDAHVIFGHTHRPGPLPGDQAMEWVGRLGARLTNTGSWTYNAGFLAPGDSSNPYWPGSCVVVEDDHSKAPQVMRLLAGSSHAQLVSSI